MLFVQLKKTLLDIILLTSVNRSKRNCLASTVDQQ